MPENAGDPLGYIPKKLRGSCKVVDCGSEEYQRKEAESKKAKEMNQEQSQMFKDMSKWAGKQKVH